MSKRAEIDWLAVQQVCEDGHRLTLRIDEVKAVIRRLDERMMIPGDYPQDIPPGKMTCEQVARLLKTTTRSIVRYRKALPPATKATCAVCGQPMWVRHDGIIEAHPTRLLKTCTGLQDRETA